MIHGLWEGRKIVIDTLAPLDNTLRTGERPKSGDLDDLLISWSEWSEDPKAVASLGEISIGLEERIAELEAQVSAALPVDASAFFTELLSLHRQRAQEWGYSGVEFARRALVTLLR
jgi:hypothetical protein